MGWEMAVFAFRNDNNDNDAALEGVKVKLKIWLEMLHTVQTLNSVI